MAKVSKSILASAAALIAANQDASIVNTSTADLLAFYNSHVERFGGEGAAQVTKFKDRQTTMLRAVTLAEKIVAAPDAAPAGKAAKPPVTADERSAAIASTWSDPEVRARRAARHPVSVGGVVHKSVMKAFTALGLDPKGHLKVRADIVSKGQAEFEGHKFVRAAAAA